MKPVAKAPAAPAAAAAAAADEDEEEDDEDDAPPAPTPTFDMLVSNGTRGEAVCVDGVPAVRYETIDGEGNCAVFEDKYCFRRSRFKVREFQLGRAGTVDTAQGSQYPHVVVVLDDGARSLTRKHLLVALSRAQKSCTLIHTDGAIEKVTRPWYAAPSAFSVCLKATDFSEF